MRRRILPPALVPGREWCTSCDQDTDWRLGRGGKFLVCGGCATRFPGQSKKCGHQDCERARR